MPSLQYFEQEDVLIDNPIRPYSFSSGEIPFALDSRPEMFDPALASQQAESFDLGLREMLRRGAPESEIRAALDKTARWAARVRPLREQYYSGGPAACDALASRNPTDADIAARCARRWIYEVEKERDVVMFKTEPGFRNVDVAQACVKDNTWYQGGKITKPSTAYASAKSDTRRALAANPDAPKALIAALLLAYRVCGGDPLRYAQKAARLSDPVASIAQAYLGMRDTRVPKLQVEMAALLASKCSSASNVLRGDGKRYDVTTCDIPPSAGERNAAAERENEVTRITAEDSAYEQAAERAFWDPDVIMMFAAKPNHTRKEHLARYGLFFNPFDFRLHELREEVWVSSAADQQRHPYFWKLFKSSDYADWAFRGGYGNSYGQCSGMYNELLYGTQYNDPFTMYIVADNCMRLEPTHPAGHVRVGYSLYPLSQKIPAKINMTDSLEDAQLENEIGYQVGARLLLHRDEWRPNDTRETITHWMGEAKFQRGETFRLMGKSALARPCYDQALSLGFNTDQVARAIARLPH